MKGQLSGNLRGLKPHQIKALERLSRRRIRAEEIITHEVASSLAELSTDIRRQIGLLIDRRGIIAHVVVGDATSLRLPDVGRLRGALGRLRGLRLVHTHLRGEGLTTDDLTDLALLRLDLVAALTIDDSLPDTLHAAHLLPANPDGELWTLLAPQQTHSQQVNFPELVSALEAELAKQTKLWQQQAGNRAIIVHVDTGAGVDDERHLVEMRELCRTAGVEVADVVRQRRKKIDAKFVVGRGKLQQILLRTMQLGADLLVFDCDLRPSQAQAISDFASIKIIDRTMLILDIFSQRASSSDGRLQVELAQLKYALPRLANKSKMMSRLAGGIGGRGPGETKLEVSRRRARDRIALLERQRRKVAEARRRRRKQRARKEVPVVAIVGYTNAGKSTLLNSLTHGNAEAENKLFATLDPISRRLRLPEEKEVVFIDTVGFIRDLPEDLLAAFRATIEEIAEADVLVQVVDASDDAYQFQLETVAGMLADLGLAEKPRLVAFNKADLVDTREAAGMAREHKGFVISARQPKTLMPLISGVVDELSREAQH